MLFLFCDFEFYACFNSSPLLTKLLRCLRVFLQVADALDPLLVSERVLLDEIGLTEEQAQAFNASIETAKRGVLLGTSKLCTERGMVTQI